MTLQRGKCGCRHFWGQLFVQWSNNHTALKPDEIVKLTVLSVVLAYFKY